MKTKINNLKAAFPYPVISVTHGWGNFQNGYSAKFLLKVFFRLPFCISKTKHFYPSLKISYRSHASN